MYRLLTFVCILSPACLAIAQDSEQDSQRASLIKRLAETKVSDGDSFTLTPDQKLLAGLKEWGDGGLAHLQNCLTDESSDVRHQSLLLLAELPGGTDLLLQSLNDLNSSAQGEILSMVGMVIRDPRFISAAGDLIDSQDKSLAIAAMSVAGRTRLLKVAHGLVEILKSDDKERSVAAAYALAQMGVPDGAKLIVEDARDNVSVPLWQGKVIDTLGRSGSPDGVDYLLEIFEQGMKMTGADDEPAGMIFSAEEHKKLRTGVAPGAGIMLTGRSASAIAAISDQRAMPVLQKGLEHPNRHVRTAALRGLSAGDPTAGKSLLAVLENATKDQAFYVIYVIAKTADKGLIDEVRKHLNGDLRDDAIAALAILGDSSVLNDALENTRSPDKRRQQMGAIAIGALSARSEKARERLVELFDDSRVGQTALSWGATALANAELESGILQWCMKQNDPRQKIHAIRALARVGTMASMDYLNSIAETEADASLRYTAALTRQVISGKDQVFVRDNGEEVRVVLTSYFATSRRMRQSAKQ
jgi:HEAT repeat protein